MLLLSQEGSKTSITSHSVIESIKFQRGNDPIQISTFIYVRCHFSKSLIQTQTQTTDISPGIHHLSIDAFIILVFKSYIKLYLCVSI